MSQPIPEWVKLLRRRREPIARSVKDREHLAKLDICYQDDPEGFAVCDGTEGGSYPGIIDCVPGLRNRTDISISCLDVHDGTFFIGTPNGLYVSANRDLTKLEQKGPKTPIQQLRIIPSQSCILVLTEWKLYKFSMPFVQIPAVQPIIVENCHLFSLNLCDPPTLCVAVGSNIHTYDYVGSKFVERNMVNLGQTVTVLANNKAEILACSKNKTYSVDEISKSSEDDGVYRKFVKILSTTPIEMFLRQTLKNAVVLSEKPLWRKKAQIRWNIENAIDYAYLDNHFFAISGHQVEVGTIVDSGYKTISTINYWPEELKGMIERDNVYLYGKHSIWVLRIWPEGKDVEDPLEFVGGVQKYNKQMLQNIPKARLEPEDMIDQLLNKGSYSIMVPNQLAALNVFTIRQFSMLSEEEVLRVDPELLPVHQRAIEIVANSFEFIASPPLVQKKNGAFGYVLLTDAEMIQFVETKELHSAYSLFNSYMTLPADSRVGHPWKSFAANAAQKLQKKDISVDAYSDIDIYSGLSWHAANSFGRSDCTASTRAIYFIYTLPLTDSRWEKRLKEKEESKMSYQHVVSINLKEVCAKQNGTIYTSSSSEGKEWLPVPPEYASQIVTWGQEGCIITPTGTIPASYVETIFSL